jgi:hypothetical protein
MIGLKDSPDFRIPDWDEMPDRFYITRKGFSVDDRIRENYMARFFNWLSIRAGGKSYNSPPY